MIATCAAAKECPSPANPRAEKRLLRLARMADIGLAIAEKLERQAVLAAAYSETDAVPDNLPHSRRLDEIARAFAQVSRAVSLATALEDRLDSGLPALPDEALATREDAAKDKRADLARAVVHAIDTDPCINNPRRVVDLRIHLDRLLDAELADLDRFLRRPFDEIEVRLRRDLGLEADEDGGLISPPPQAAACGGGGPRNRGGGGLRVTSDERRSFCDARFPEVGPEVGTEVGTGRPAAPSPLHHFVVPLPQTLPRSVEEDASP